MKKETLKAETLAYGAACLSGNQTLISRQGNILNEIFETLLDELPEFEPVAGKLPVTESPGAENN